MSGQLSVITNIVFIDAAVSDSQTLIAGLPNNSTYFVLDAQKDGIEQIEQFLAGYSNLYAIQILSHGSQGSLFLGNTVLSNNTLNQYQDQLANIGSHLKDTGDILLYGCNVAEGDTGLQFIDALAKATGADVAASTDLTGASALGGNWLLEAQTGSIEAATLHPQVYNAVLATITGGEGNDTLTGTNTEDTINGRAGNDTINGKVGADTITGGYGNDTIQGGDGNDYINGGSTSEKSWYKDIIYAGAGDDTVDATGFPSIYGEGGNDKIRIHFSFLLVDGGDGDDEVTIEGWGPSYERGSLINGGSGFDRLLLNIASPSESNNLLSTVHGFERITAWADEQRKLVLTSNLVEINKSLIVDGATGSSLGDLHWVDGSQVLGNLQIHMSNDGYAYGGQGNDIILVEDLGRTNGALRIWGNGGNDTISGGSIADFISGGLGDDSIDGGDGLDTAIYSGNYANYTISEITYNTFSVKDNVGTDGTDTIIDINKLQFADHTVDVEIRGMEIIGDETAEEITGGNEADHIDGAGGNDVLDGGLGNDLVDGGTGNDTLIGGAGNDAINGGAGNDSLNGGTGNDSLIGGAGNDTYIVDSTSDVINEATTSTSEIDEVQASVSWTLGANLENLTLSGTAANGTGNVLANTIIGDTAANILDGGAGNDTLVGGAGSDTLVGGAGNDTYIVDSTSDVINEATTSTSDIDGVQASVSWTLGANIENLTLSGTAANGTGNVLANTIIGDTAANILDGGAGNDTLFGGEGTDSLIGGLGNDTLNGGIGADILYAGSGNDVVDAGAGDDLIVGGDGEGNDTYLGGDGFDTIKYTSAVADITVDLLTGTVFATAGADAAHIGVDSLSGIEGIIAGNYNDTIIGNNDNNVINGEAGNDTITGGSGNDTINGGDGSDSAVFSGAYANYTKSFNSVTNQYTFIANSGNDGTDIVSNVEFFKFSDITAAASSLVNTAPTFTSFASTVASGNEDNQRAISFANLQTQGNEADVDGTVSAFVIKTVSTGSLLIGTAAGTATAWNASTNNSVDATHQAYWTPVANANGSLNAFTAVAKDNGGLESATAIQATVSVTAVNDAPSFTTFASTVASGNEDNQIAISFANLQTQGNEADVDGTVTAFVIKAVSSGTLLIGTTAGTATAWNASTNNSVDATHQAYWTPVANANGTLNAFTAVAKDNGSLASATAVQATVSVTTVNDIPTFNAFTTIVATGNEDSQITVTFANLKAQGNEADVDGTVSAFVIKSVSTGSLLIGTTAGTATAWNALTNNTVDATHQAYWTPVANANGTLNAFTAVAKDNGGLESVTAIQVTVAVEASNTVNGKSDNDNLVGQGGNDVLNGLAGNDTLDGGAGDDSMLGGDGNDLYYVRQTGDNVTELNANLGSGGNDTVYSYLADYRLSSNVENGQVMNTTAANLVGNSLNNMLYAGNGDNVLDGDIGNDTVSYVYASAGITANLATSAAQDTEASGMDTLRNIENLNGSQYDDTLIGNSAANKLNGGLDADVMIGRNGSDTYYVDNSNDIVVESNVNATTGGIDLVISSLADYLLPANVENITLTDATASNGAGNALNNTLIGNAAANVLTGGAGNDSLVGGAGNDYLDGGYDHDTLTGDLGIDTFSVGKGTDTITDLGADGADILSVSSGAAANATINTAWTASAATTNSGTANISTNGLVVNLAAVTTGTNGYKVTNTGGATTLTGSALADTLIGGAGNDTITGGSGNDTINGGDGSDSAVFSGAYANYTKSFNSVTNQYTLIANSGNDGTDIVSNVEFFKFSDITAAASSLLGTSNTVPVFTAFASTVATGNEDNQIAISFANLQTQGNEADVDGTVTAFVIKAVSSGTLLIGTTAGTATAWNALTNNTVDATHQAYWTPVANANGTLNAFTAVAKDNGGLESVKAIQVRVAVTPINDTPTGTVTITGTATQGQQLTAANTLADVDGMGAVTYKWYVSGSSVSIGTGSTYTLSQAQVGKTITVQASYTDLLGTAENVSSSSTANVAVIDSISPTVTGFSPADGTTAVTIGSNVVLTFSEAIQKGTGTIAIHSVSATGTVIESFNAATSNRLTFSGSTLTIDPSSNLANNTQYFVTFASGTIKDLAGNNYAGTTTYDFTTTKKLITDTSVNIALNLDALALDANNIASISLSDNKPLSITATQLTNDASALAKISGGYSLSVSAVPVVVMSMVLANSHVTSLSIIDTQANFIKNLDALNANVSFISSITLTDSHVLSITAAQKTAATTLLSKIVGGYTLEASNAVNGTSGNDNLVGQGGNDVLNGLAGNDTLIGGLGIDTFTVASGTDTITDLGAGGADVLSVSSGATANATINTAWTASALTKNSGIANISTNGLVVNLAAVTTGTIGYKVTNTGSATTLTGSALADTLMGGMGNDGLVGGIGNDTLTGGSGNDSIDGGLGEDAVVFSLALSDYTVTYNSSTASYSVAAKTGNEGTDTVTNVEYFQFSDGARYASALQSIITGTTENDSLGGTSGDDQLLGLGGNDSLSGGLGNDILTGGAGTDTFIVANGTDIITDLGAGGADVLSVSSGAAANATINTAWTASAATINRGTANISTNGLVVNLAAVTTGTIGYKVTNTGIASTLTGSALADTLIGGVGNDSLVGGAGNDTLIGGLGIDTFTVASGTDTITDLGAGGADILSVGNGATANATIVYKVATIIAGSNGIIFRNNSEWTASASTTNSGTANISTNGLVVNLAAVTTGAYGYKVTNTGSESTLTGSALNDTLIGGAGNDTLTGGAGNDKIDGGLGEDTVVYSLALSDYTVSYNSSTASYSVAAKTGNEGTDTVTNVEYFQFSDGTPYASALKSIIPGKPGNESLVGTSSDDQLLGLGGNDSLNGGWGNDILTGGAGIDTFIVANGTDTIADLGADGADILSVSYGATANATINTAWTASAVTINSGTANISTNGLVVNLAAVTTGTIGYKVTNTGSATTLTGSALADTLIGGKGNDSLVGGAGNDTLIGGAGNDSLTGGSGLDTFIVGKGGHAGTSAITDLGADGADILSVSNGATANATISKGWTASASTKNSGTVNITTNGLVVNLAAVTTGDYGYKVTNTGSASILTGSALADTLIGGAGNDTLVGGLGNDTLTGGAGNDVFLFNTTANSVSNVDKITDFEHGTDSLQFSKSIFTGITSAAGSGLGTTLATGEFVSTATAVSGTTRTSHFIYNTASGILYYDADGSDSGTSVQVALVGVSSHPVLTFSDFHVIA
jgi:Ca2+-binding RTX toxin-like protein